MAESLHARSSLLAIAALSLVACGSDEMAPPPSSVATATPTPSPTPTPTPTPTAADFNLISDIQYTTAATETGTVDLFLDIYQPEETCDTPRPTIFYVHGGGFRFGDKADDIVEALAPRITEQGINFVSINYRVLGDRPVLTAEFEEVAQAYADEGLLDPNGDLFTTIIASIEDGVTALNWMEENASTYCLDMSNLGYWGSSAGTVITAQIAYSLNQYEIERPEPVFVNAWWGEVFRISDLEMGEAPFLILHGDQDEVADYQSSVNLAAQAEIVAVPFAFYTLLDTEHGFDTNAQQQTSTGFDASVDFAVAQLTGGVPIYGRFDIPK